MNNLYQALSHPVRRKILKLLGSGALPAGELAAHFDVSKPTMSGHFNVLKDAGLIQPEREGTTIRYRLNVSVLEEAAAATESMKGEAEALLHAIGRFRLAQHEGVAAGSASVAPIAFRRSEPALREPRLQALPARSVSGAEWRTY